MNILITCVLFTIGGFYFGMRTNKMLANRKRIRLLNKITYFKTTQYSWYVDFDNHGKNGNGFMPIKEETYTVVIQSVIYKINKPVFDLLFNAKVELAFWEDIYKDDIRPQEIINAKGRIDDIIGELQYEINKIKNSKGST
jgi:hypothetical protein